MGACSGRFRTLAHMLPSRCRSRSRTPSRPNGKASLNEASDGASLLADIGKSDTVSKAPQTARQADPVEQVHAHEEAKHQDPNPLQCGYYSAPVMTDEEFSRIAVPFDQVSQRLAAIMDEHGVAVVTGVVQSEQELQEMEDDFKQDLMELVDARVLDSAPEDVQRAYRRFTEGGPRCFPVRTATACLTASAGFCLDSCLAHGRFAWRVRRHPNVHTAFRALFPGSSNLVTSLDVTFFTPGGQRPAERNDFVAHVDQNKHDVRPGLADCHSYQGVFYVWPSGADGRSSTTVVWPGSHRQIFEEMMKDEMFEMNGSYGMHYSEIQAMENLSSAWKLAAGWQANARRVPVPAGGLLLWSSKTVHTGWKGGPRLAQTVCLQPASMRPEAERLAKMRLAALGLPGCHWANAAMQHDMMIGAPGCFSESSVQAEGGDGDPDTVILPLHPSIRPRALAKGADMERLEGLIDIDYRLVGMWDPIEGSSELLENSVEEPYKEYL